MNEITVERQIRMAAIAAANQRLGPAGISPTSRAVTELIEQAQRIAAYIATGAASVSAS